MTPQEGMTVSRWNRKNRLIYGEIVRVHTDGVYDFFTVEWSEDSRVEYNTAREWGNSVFATTCRVCDSAYHNDCEEGY